MHIVFNKIAAPLSGFMCKSLTINKTNTKLLMFTTRAINEYEY